MTDQKTVADWWAQNPMTYGAVHGRTEYTDGAFSLGDAAFFDRLDNEFYNWNRPLHGARPFDHLFPYELYRGKRVLEVGCGLGTMAMNWARAGAQVTAIDLNPTSIAQTRRRFEIFGLTGTIELADARHLQFDANSFDYVYSWGVIHHSPDIQRSTDEIMRVLKPGGGFGIMIYNRRSLLHWYLTEYVEGFLHYENQFLGPLELASRYGDGGREEGNPHTWPMTPRELLALVASASGDAQVRILGTDLDYVFSPLLPGLGRVLPAFAKKVWARRLGWSIWGHGHKRQGS